MTVFFDVGDVLVVDRIDRKFADLAEKYRLDPASLLATRIKYRRRADLGEISDPQFWQFCLADFGITALPEDWNLEAYYEELPGTRDLVKQLAEHGHRLAIITDDSHEMARQRWQCYGYDGLFEKVIISSDYGVGKPDLEIFLIALQEMDCTPEMSVFVDNLESNLVGARQAGMQTILFKNAQQLQHDLSQLHLL
jgi:2-haloacid dehalogenase